MCRQIDFVAGDCVAGNFVAGFVSFGDENGLACPSTFFYDWHCWGGACCGAG